MSSDGEVVKYATQLARRSTLKIVVYAAGFLALLEVENIYYQSAITEASARLTQAARLKGDILLADETLTMSAANYASSGNEAMHERYLATIPVIDVAIAEAKKLAPPTVAAMFDEQTRVANDELVKLEMQSFNLVAQHHMGDAARIFTSFTYLNNKKVLKEGIDRFLVTLESELAAADSMRHWTALILAAISTIGIIGFGVVWKRLNAALVKSERAFLAADAKIRSELTSAHEEIQRKTRMAQLGYLIATIAHELRNPLSVIRTSVFLIKRKLADKDPTISGPLERINNSIVRCDNVISQLLDYSRTGEMNKLEVDFDNWLAKTIEEVALGLPSMVEIEYSLGLGGHKLYFDPDRMRRVLINLVANASEAMVGTDDIPALTNGQVPRIHIESRMTVRGVELAVADNGPGISLENLAKILEPLFTTKSFGTGLGLPTVQNILERHGGGLDIACTAGSGAVFTAWFPNESPAKDITDIKNAA
jgi:signal transduction histidine kinase